MAQDTSIRVGINGQLLSGKRSYRSAGVSGYIRQLLACLPWAAPDLAFTAFVPDGAQPPAAGLNLRPSRRWNTHQPLRRILWEQLALPLLIRQAGLALLHAPVNVSPLAAGCPTVVTVHDLSFMRYPQAFPHFQRSYLRSQARRSVRAAARVIAVSEATKRDVMAFWGLPASRIDVVYNGVDAAFCPASPVEVAEFRRRQGLPARFILHLGTLEPRKNLVRLVRAFSSLKQDRRRNRRLPAAGRDGISPYGDLKLVLAGGKGWDYEAIFREVAGQGLEDEVLFPGYLPDEELAWWYRAATIFAYPSLLEGFGLPVIEAMACGAPVVTSNVSSLPEVAGDAALLVDPASTEALAEALRRLLDEPGLAEELRQRGLRQAARFSWKQTAEETAAVYRRSLSVLAPAGQSATLQGAADGGGLP